MKTLPGFILVITEVKRFRLHVKNLHRINRETVLTCFDWLGEDLCKKGNVRYCRKKTKERRRDQHGRAKEDIQEFMTTQRPKI